jgi:hypothetical protein
MRDLFTLQISMEYLLSARGSARCGEVKGEQALKGCPVGGGSF